MDADSRPRLSLSLDLDNKWSYLKIHGDAGWEAFPSYLEPLSRIVLERLRRHALTITVFVVGQDAAREENSSALGVIAEAGHEIGNHSFHHEPWLHTYARADLEGEIARAETAIEAATGQRPVGFRGPGFSFSADLLEVLAKRCYLYDASTFPTFLGPLARAYYFLHSRGMSAEERQVRKRLFGSLHDGLRPLKPYRWRLADDARLLEIPVTTMPLVRAPIHLSYLLYLARFSRLLSRLYLHLALGLLRLRRVEPSFLLHPLDFLGGDRVSGLEFFPGMDLSTDFKLRFFDGVIATLKRRYRIVTMEQHARAWHESGRVRELVPGS